MATLKPITNLMVEEIEHKLEARVSFDFGALLSGDVTAKDRATKGLVDAGVKLEDALKMAGLNPTGD